jgi:hypothetical protein
MAGRADYHSHIEVVAGSGTEGCMWRRHGLVGHCPPIPYRRMAADLSCDDDALKGSCWRVSGRLAEERVRRTYLNRKKNKMKATTMTPKRTHLPHVYHA